MNLPQLSLIRRVLEEAAPGAINLAHGEPTHAPPAPVHEALARSVAAGELSYTQTAGLPELRSALAARFPHHGGGPGSILVTVGAQESLAVALLGLLDSGDEVIVPEWSYPTYRALPALAGAVAIAAADADVEAALSPRTRLLIVASPGNPTGEVLPAGRLAELTRLAEERGAYLLSDEVYADLYFSATAPPQPAGRRVVHIGSISKIFALTGLRLGWLAADPAVVSRLVPLHQHLVTCAARPAQRAALAALALPAADLAPVRDLYRRRWLQMRGWLARVEGLTWREPGGAFYVFVDARDLVGEDTLSFALALARAGEVLVVPSEAFGDRGGFLRLAFSTTEDRIDEGCRRLVDALARAGRESTVGVGGAPCRVAAGE